MKRILLTVLAILMLLTMLCFTGCQEKNEYTPTGEFYVKTLPSRGDGGVAEVISLEAEHKTYEDDGDITVPMTVGLGHLHGHDLYGDDVQDTFYVLYKIIESPWTADKKSAWEKKVEYTDSWYDSKYDSTEQENRSFLIFPHYGEFYPLYKETVDIVFPADVEYGCLYVELYIVIEGQEDRKIAALSCYFKQENGILTLDDKFHTKSAD